MMRTSFLESQKIVNQNLKVQIQHWHQLQRRWWHCNHSVDSYSYLRNTSSFYKHRKQENTVTKYNVPLLLGLEFHYKFWSITSESQRKIMSELVSFLFVLWLQESKKSKLLLGKNNAKTEEEQKVRCWFISRWTTDAKTLFKMNQVPNMWVISYILQYASVCQSMNSSFSNRWQWNWK